MKQLKALLRHIAALSVLLFYAATAHAQIDGIGLRTQLPQWVFLSPGAGVDISWNGRYMASVFGSYGDWNFSKDTKWVTVSTAGIDVRRYMSNGTASWGNPNGGSYHGMYLGLAGRLLNFDNWLTTESKQGNIWTVGPIVGYTFRLVGNWTCDASVGVGYCYDDYTRYKYYPPAEINREVNKEKGGRFGLTDLSIAIAYRFKL